MNRYNPDIHHRRSIRLPRYDYSSAGAYFVTLCTHERQCLFGEIVDGEMRLNDFGRIVTAEWIRSGELRAEIEIGEYVVMPNHFHGIVMIDDTVGANGIRPVSHTPDTNGRFRSPSKNIGSMVRGFKSSVTKQINVIRNTPDIPVWQRNYYEHVIRNDADYTRIAEYVADNPRRWAEDTLHPDNFVITSTTGKTNGGGGNVVGAYGNTPGFRSANSKSDTNLKSGERHSGNQGECHSPLRNVTSGDRHE
jgi:REP element-mobilizing transposase RayT